MTEQDTTCCMNVHVCGQSESYTFDARDWTRRIQTVHRAEHQMKSFLNLNNYFTKRQTATHKRLVHGAARLVAAVAVDLLEERVERGVALGLLVLLLFLDVGHQLVPVARVVRRRRVLYCRRCAAARCWVCGIRCCNVQQVTTVNDSQYRTVVCTFYITQGRRVYIMFSALCEHHSHALKISLSEPSPSASLLNNIFIRQSKPITVQRRWNI